MKPLKLTPKHKTKLLEMCEILFQNFSPFDLELEPQYDGSQYHIIFRYMKNNMFEIHWFEFCMTHLVDKLNNIKFNNNDSSFIFWKDIAISNRHMVDYLYDEFKKLNK